MLVTVGNEGANTIKKGKIFSNTNIVFKIPPPSRWWWWWKGGVSTAEIEEDPHCGEPVCSITEISTNVSFEID